jgi:hypothetical protein
MDGWMYIYAHTCIYTYIYVYIYLYTHTHTHTFIHIYTYVYVHRYLVPASMVANLDFVESIFGNGDNPDLAENDAALDPEHWTGCTGLVILAPHLVRVKAKDVGLPHKSVANERALKDGLYYEKDDDLYNGGKAFKITARDARGVVVTIIADNYFGYCKKETKTQLSYATNVIGMSEEEHAGGCIAYPCFDLGEEVTLLTLLALLLTLLALLVPTNTDAQVAAGER